MVLCLAAVLSACDALLLGDQGGQTPERVDAGELVLAPGDVSRGLVLDAEVSGYLEQVGRKVWGDEAVRTFKRYGGTAGYVANYARQGAVIGAFSLLALRSAVWVHATEKGARDHFEYLRKNLAKGWSVVQVPSLGDETFAAGTEQTLSGGQRRVLVQFRVRKGRFIADVTTATARGAMLGQEVLEVARLAVEKLPDG